MRNRRLVRSGIIGGAVGCVGGWMIGMGGVAVMAGSAGVMAVVLAAPVIRGAWRHVRLTSALNSVCSPATVHGFPVHTGQLSRAALVAGLHQPEIYVDTNLLADLSDDELTAVLLHEHAHKLGRDPLRAVLIDSLSPVVRHWHGGRLLAALRATAEIRADKYAIRHGASRTALASALLKVAPVPGGGVGFSSAVDLRLRALLGEDLRPPLSGLIGHLACVALVAVPTAAGCAALNLHETIVPQIMASLT
ncbi:M56 family metallopeptidase [Euzebya sp.]|uniref:M56 family metallopeptidase n=1 Tax=Euzebya sp. TaxID=1971409 RepID=UPI003517531A